MYISSFNISGYRSLKNVQIPKMLQVCIFHGLNNSGKSNILSAIETIFRRKLVVEETTTDQATKIEQVTKHEREGNFWQGRITEFRDNFYLNGKDDITFSVSICLTDDELAFLKDVLKRLAKHLAKVGYKKILTLTGRIKYVDDASADMVLERAVFNNRYVVFEVDGSSKKSFFPKVDKLSTEERLTYFDKLMDLLADSFALLPSDRYLTSEQMDKGSTGRPALTPKTFKQWLFRLDLSRSDHKAFEEIKTMFASKPFSCGDIGFSKEGDEIEVMVKEKNVRLPISRLGSGYQQIIYIIANLVLNKKKMMGIEELEINLSPTAQKMVFEKLKYHIYKGSDLISQIIITSHSNYFKGRTDVRRYSVEHNDQETIVKPLTTAVRKSIFPNS
ncbi:MAG: AAA family ATPase [Planctomycetota bacterium]